MSLFDTLASSFGESASPGSDSPGLVGAALNYINNQPGGVSGLIQRFHEEGAGDIVSSWIGTGPNKDIDPQTLTQVLGSEPVAALAEKAGMSPDQFSGLLAMVLPNLVDKATPDGQVPADGKLQADDLLSSLGGLAGLFGKSAG